jgi:hypothetical protein
MTNHRIQGFYRRYLEKLIEKAAAEGPVRARCAPV